MKILLIRPKSTYGDVVAGIPIGVTVLASVAEAAGHEVKILDLGLEEDPGESLARACKDRYDLAGISCMSVEFLGGVEVAEAIRGMSPSTHILFGGQHPTIMSEQVMKKDCIDSICIGEGEDIFSELLEHLDRGEELDGIEGLWFRRNGEVVRNPPRNGYVDVDAVPMPAYHLLDIERYFDLDFVRFPTADHRALQIFTSRG